MIFFFYKVFGRRLLCRLSALLMRPTFEKRQGTKSRLVVQWRFGGVLWGLAGAFCLRRFDRVSTCSSRNPA